MGVDLNVRFLKLSIPIKAVILCLWMVLFLCTNLYSADLTENYLKNKPHGNTIDKATWQKLKNNYKYKSPKPVTEKTKTQLTSTFSLNASWLSILAYALIFFIAGIIIYYLIKYTINGNQKFANKPTDFDVHSEIEDINSINLPPLLQEAIKNADYKLATRIQFLILLQILNQKKIIKFNRQKTNLDYLHQLFGKTIERSFSQHCLIFERVWYGDFIINADSYKIIEQQFNLTFLKLNDKEFY